MLKLLRHLRRPTNSFKSLNLFRSKIAWISDAIEGVSTTIDAATTGKAETGTGFVIGTGTVILEEVFEELDALILFLLSIP